MKKSLFTYRRNFDNCLEQKQYSTSAFSPINLWGAKM
jgi:hypothetical protein